MKISRILHAGYIFEHKGVRIAFDPIFENPFSRNCYAFPAITFDQEQIKNLNLSAIFISHYHDDHLSLESLNFLNRDIPIYLYSTFPEFFKLVEELGFKYVHPLSIDKPITVGEITVTPRRALDADVDSIFHLQTGHINILNVVDSWIDPETLKKLVSLSSWDLILWPFQMMREMEVLSPYRASWAKPELPPEWKDQLRALNPKFLVPSSCQFVQESWSWYNTALFPISYSDFAKWARDILPEVQVVRIDPSQSFTLTEQGLEENQPLPWVKLQGNQDVDYCYDPKIPTTADVAKNFPALTGPQIEKVLCYCEQEIVEKFRCLHEIHEYFQQPRVWKLSLFDHHGKATVFFYQVESNSLKRCPPCDKEKLAWSTELPISKLLAAMTDGESLTSMYVRINGDFFSPEIEKDLQFVDLLEDPLIRCLFSEGNVDSYQRAQLKRLKKSNFYSFLPI